METISQNKMVNRKELAKALGVSYPQIETLMRQGLPRVIVGGGKLRTHCRYDLEQVKAWLASRTAAADGKGVAV